MMLGSLFWSGLVATVVAYAFFRVASAFGWTLLNPPVQLGCLVIADPRKPIAETIGFFGCFALGILAVPFLFQAALALWSGPGWIGGVVVGGFLGLVLAASLPLYGMISASVRSGTMPSPGLFGLGWGQPTPGVVFAGSMLYGAIFAAIYAAF